MGEGLQTFLHSMVELFFLTATLFLIVGIQALRKRLTREQQQLAEDLVRSAVLYVQQTMPLDQPAVKLETALQAAKHLLEEKGVTVDEETVLLHIEAQVKKLKQELGEYWQGQQD